uniref:Uncharacterized protein n=1 Tax=viral metagenome TaxID=1070528 RepID=A0A6M3Y4R4_9ZZZZ
MLFLLIPALLLHLLGCPHPVLYAYALVIVGTLFVLNLAAIVPDLEQKGE